MKMMDILFYIYIYMHDDMYINDINVNESNLQLF